jgi:integrase/recombinase XerD
MRPNKQANLICPQQEEAVLRYLTTTRNPQRDRALFLLALKAGLNARDIAALTWSIVTDPDGPISNILSITIQNTWGIHHRHIPMHPTLRAALIDLYEHQKLNVHPDQPVIYSIRSKGLSSATVKDWFRRLYQTLGMEGYASMSGRRTFITRAAQIASEGGGNLCDVQRLAGYASLQTTQRYAEENQAVEWKLIKLL